VPALLDIRSVSRSFPGVRALDKVSLTLARGEVLALIGENGAGKSTLMKILAGIEQPDSGAIHLDGSPVTIASPRVARELGIALIHQELNLAGNLTVAANIFLGREPRVGCFIDRCATETASSAALAQVGLSLSPRTLVDTLSLAQQQLVEIARALSTNARVLIMDEPTSSLSLRDAETLFHVVRQLRASGTSIIYISHRLGEVKQLADRVVVLRDGRNAGELARDEIEHDRMVRLMVGRDFRAGAPAPCREDLSQTPAIELTNFCTPTHPRQPLNFTIFPGEIVGLAGLVGAGRTEVLECLFGVQRPVSGGLRVNGTSVAVHSPQQAIHVGLALVPEDRKLQGVILEMAVRDNLSLASLRQDARGPFVNRGRIRAIAGKSIQSLRIRASSDRQFVQYLSGGNQQKVALGKWLALQPRVLLLDEPTRGVDVGAKQEIYALMEDLARSGAAILFASSDMEEVLRMSHCVLVMHEGRLAGELRQGAISEEAVMQLATGNLRA
jgi:ribose transport system ATP-binding protein